MFPDYFVNTFCCQTCWKVVSHCTFNLHFFGYKYDYTSFHIFKGLIFSFFLFVNVCLYILLISHKGMFFLFLSLFLSPLYIRDIYSERLEVASSWLLNHQEFCDPADATLVRLSASCEFKICHGGNMYSLVIGKSHETGSPPCSAGHNHRTGIFWKLEICFPSFLTCLFVWLIDVFCCEKKKFTIAVIWIMHISAFSLIAFWVLSSELWTFEFRKFLQFLHYRGIHPYFF